MQIVLFFDRLLLFRGVIDSILVIDPKGFANFFGSRHWNK
jgi:hypothetical protein